ncbi:MAG: tetratricopeptide repeat protein, partial [Anaerolineaceae bacterium]|nr:tetratricopeptide repeat protein [Anaerolineaceae bacterium]
PGTAPAYNKIGWIQHQTGTPQQAINAYEQAIALDPHFLPSYDGLGFLYATKLFDYERAIETYQRGLAANPANPYLAAYLGSTYMRMGQMEKALEILEKTVKDHPEQILAHDWLSYLYLHMQRLDEAAVCCRREIELKEDAHSPHRVLGYIYHALDRKDDAIAELERAIELEPHDYEARGALANAYRESGNPTGAEFQYNTGREMAMQEDKEAGLACFYAVYGNVEQALDLLEKGIAKGQVHPSWVRIDPEFAFIQHEPRFQALIG